jgi:hypothetical protein
MPVHAGMYRRYLSRIERRAQIDAFDHRSGFVSDRVEPHGDLRVFAKYNAFGAQPSRGLVNTGVGLMAFRRRPRTMMNSLFQPIKIAFSRSAIQDPVCWKIIAAEAA